MTARRRRLHGNQAAHVTEAALAAVAILYAAGVVVAVKLIDRAYRRAWKGGATS